MKTTTALVLALTLFAAIPLLADDVPIDPKDLPAAVTQTLEDYFPKHKILKAEKDGEKEFEVLIQYKEIKLEVDLTPAGKIRDVDMKD
ncbi:MAG: hypothetical protein AAGK14_13030 [Verrucomicrobiota bacterium]